MFLYSHAHSTYSTVASTAVSVLSRLPSTVLQLLPLCLLWLFCIFFFVLLLVLKCSKRVCFFICTRLCVSVCVCVCVLALYVVCLSVSSLSLWRDTDRDTDISHRTTKKVKNAARVYLCMPISLSFPPSPSLSLSLSRKLAWHNNFRQRVFCPKMKVKLFRAALINVFYVAPKSMLQFSFALCSGPKFPTRPSWPLSVCVCVSFSVCVRVFVCAEVLGVNRWKLISRSAINVVIGHTHTLALTHTRGKRSTARAN